MLASYVLFHGRVNYLVQPRVEYPKNNGLFITKDWPIILYQL